LSSYTASIIILFGQNRVQECHAWTKIGAKRAICFCVYKVFFKKFKFFYGFGSYWYTDVKNNLKNNIILIYFQKKTLWKILKNNINHILEFHITA